MGPSLASAQQPDRRAQAPMGTEVPASEEKAPNTGRVSLGLGVDWVSAWPQAILFLRTPHTQST